jgi:hypothetical protein
MAIARNSRLGGKKIPDFDRQALTQQPRSLREARRPQVGDGRSF